MRRLVLLEHCFRLIFVSKIPVFWACKNPSLIGIIFFANDVFNCFSNETRTAGHKDNTLLSLSCFIGAWHLGQFSVQCSLHNTKIFEVDVKSLSRRAIDWQHNGFEMLGENIDRLFFLLPADGRNRDEKWKNFLQTFYGRAADGQTDRRTDGPDPVWVRGVGHLACPLGFGVLGRHARTYGLQQTRPRPQTPDPRPYTLDPRPQTPDPEPDPAVATIHLSHGVLP